jgi:hypothetical protein
MTLTRQDTPRVTPRGLPDMALTPVGWRSTPAPPPVATQTPDRTPWLLIIASVLMVATMTGHYYRVRRRRSGAVR